MEAGAGRKRAGGVKHSCLWRALLKTFSQALSGKPGDVSTSFTTLISALLCMFGYDPFLKSVIWEEREEHYLKGIPQPFLPSRSLAQCGTPPRGEREIASDGGMSRTLGGEMARSRHQPFD